MKVSTNVAPQLISMASARDSAATGGREGLHPECNPDYALSGGLSAGGTARR
jgi:hypothetical protein